MILPERPMQNLWKQAIIPDFEYALMIHPKQGFCKKKHGQKGSGFPKKTGYNNQKHGGIFIKKPSVWSSKWMCLGVTGKGLVPGHKKFPRERGDGLQGGPLFGQEKALGIHAFML